MVSCVTSVHDAFKSWRERSPHDKPYLMRLKYHKLLGDCSETINAINVTQFLNAIRANPCDPSFEGD